MFSESDQTYLSLHAARENVSSSHDTANVITTTIGGGLSMIAVLFVATSYVKLDEVRASGTTAEKLLLYIIMADFISAFASVLGVWFPSNKAGCKVEGFFIIFSTTASYFWTSCLAIHLFLLTTNKLGSVGMRHLMASFHVVSWGLPLILASVALGAGALGPSPYLTSPKVQKYIKLTTGGWCWIKDFGDKDKTVAWTLMTSKFWELGSYLLITVLCWTIFFRLRSQLRLSVDVGIDTLTAARKLERRMMFIPIAFVLLRVWGTIRYFAYVSNFSVGHDVLENVPLYALQGLGDSSQGFANSIFFCLSNKRVYHYWKNVLFNQCCRGDSASNERSPLVQAASLQL